MEKNKLGVELQLDRIIVEQIKAQDEERESGFRVPASAREKNVNLPKYGWIVAVGPGDPQKGPMALKEGDLICYQFYSGMPLTFQNKDYMIMRAGDVVFTLPNKNRSHE